jgi:hypothetical protein
MSGNYDIQQVCENGHQITGCYDIGESERQEFCQKCGAPTIIACPICNDKIQGDRLGENLTGWDSIERSVVPSYCSNCGKPYPWTENKIVTAIQMFAEFGNLDDKEKDTIEQDIKNIAKDIPQAELSAMRIKRVWEKYSPVAYNVIMEFASKTAAKILKG